MEGSNTHNVGCGSEWWWSRGVGIGISGLCGDGGGIPLKYTLPNICFDFVCINFNASQSSLQPFCCCCLDFTTSPKGWEGLESFQWFGMTSWWFLKWVRKVWEGLVMIIIIIIIIVIIIIIIIKIYIQETNHILWSKHLIN